jgi:hypothetical protein
MVHGCQWTCDESAWYTVNSDKTWCVSNALPSCWTNIDVRNKTPVSYSSLCDSESTYRDWYSWVTDYNTKAWREYIDWCGPQSWTWICKHNVSWKETRCLQRKKVAYFGISFTPGSIINWIVGTLRMGPDNFYRSDVSWFTVELKFTSRAWNVWYLTLAVSPIDQSGTQERESYTLRVWGTPSYGERNTTWMPKSYLGGDQTLDKLEIVAIHPRGFRSDSVWWTLVPVYDELAFNKDVYGSKYCGSNPNGWLVYKHD